MKTAYPQNSNVVSIRLYSNIPFDNTYKNHSLISERFKYNNTQIYTGSTTACERFIDRQVGIPPLVSYKYPRFDLTGEFNFDFKNGLIGSITLELTPEQTNANYMRVKVGDATHGYEYYYYFITSINQSNVDTYTLTLECDVLMTYQDEFLDGINNIPAFTNRKHCHRYTSNGLRPYSSDLKTGEDIFSGVKPNIIEKTHKLEYASASLKTIKDVVWLYICCDNVHDDYGSDFHTLTCQGVNYPFSLLVLPLNCGMKIQDEDGVYTSYSPVVTRYCVRKLINEGSFHGAKISHYPPFTSGNATIEYDGNDPYVVLTAGTSTRKTSPFNYMIMGIDGRTLPSPIPYNTFVVKQYNVADTDGNAIRQAMNKGALLITDLHHLSFSLRVANDFNTQFENAQAPSVLSNRYPDPKLLFKPFKKYLLLSKYSADGVELYPELLFSEYLTLQNTSYFEFETIVTPYIGDMSCYTYLKPYTIATGDNVWNDYGINRVGLAGTMNYTMPVGQNALDVFNATQANAFYQSKFASGITGGLSIAGGIASIVAGAGMTVGTSGALSPVGMGLVASGSMAIAGGVAGIANSVASTNAKIEDLKNTPDSINVAGSSFISDYTLDKSYILPYIAVYGVSSVVKENANDFFYQFGYQVARECYFNTELAYTPANHTTDNNLFGRTIFNYIQLNDDITNKIDADIPLVVKQKLSKIFNDGITLWTFFGFAQLWKNTTVELPANQIDKWFMKCTLDNTEYSES